MIPFKEYFLSGKCQSEIHVPATGWQQSVTFEASFISSIKFQDEVQRQTIHARSLCEDDVTNTGKPLCILIHN